jgi:hypothetical protein
MEQPGSDSQCTRGQLVAKIRESIASGYGIVPLIGSGMSAASGIPAGRDYHAYLFHCLTRVFGNSPSDNDRPPGRWDPSTLRWPNFGETPKYPNLREAMLTWSEAMHAQVNASRSKQEPDVARDFEAMWQACGAVADWRATLHLLSRIHLEGSAKSPTVRLKDPDSKVVDSFFVSITEGRKPNTAHMLLAHLADILRIKVMLTTNFDNLIELGFQRLDMPVATFDVHYDAGLPDARLVRARRSIIKLHGGRYGLRADFSLDRSPRHDDIDRFLSYLSVLSGHGRIEGRHQHNILVMGISGQDGRTIDFLCNALLEFPKNFQVFWVCHTNDEIETTRTTFRHHLDTVARGRKIDAAKASKQLSKLLITSTPDLGLFLLELYQTLFFGLPPAGVPFSTIWPVPPPTIANDSDQEPAPLPSEATQRLLEAGKELCAAIERRIDAGLVRNTPGGAASGRPAAPGGLLVVTGPRGLPLVASEAFYRLKGRVHCLWFAITPTFNPSDLIMQVIESIAREVGMLPIPPFPPDPHNISLSGVPEFLTMRLESLVAYASRSFVLFINARDVKKDDREDDKGLSGMGNLDRVVEWLGSISHVTVVLLCHKDSVRKKSLAADDHFETREAVELRDPQHITDLLVDRLGAGDPADKIQLARFTLALALFRYPCYLSALHCWALQKASDAAWTSGDNSASRFQRARDHLLPPLRSHGIVRDDQGQSVYIYPELRDPLIKSLRKVGGVSAVDQAETHQGIADWYVKLYRASGDIHAAMESISHRLRCIDLAARPKAPTDGDDFAERQGHLCASAANEIDLALQGICPSVLSSVRLGTLLHIFSELDADARRCCDALDGVKGEDGMLERAAESLQHCRETFLKFQNRYLSQIGRLKNGSGAPPRSKASPAEAPLSAHTDLAEAESRLSQAMIGRRYSEAVAVANGILRELGIGPISNTARVQARKWVRSHLGVLTSALPIAVRTARRFQQLCLYQVHISRLNRGAKENPKKLAYERDMLIAGERLFVFATEVLRYADDLRFLQEEMGQLRSGTGILLSWMNRHDDAHRQYSEAYGYFDTLSGPAAPLRFATVDLRRVQTFLSQLQKARVRQLRFGLIYDAIAAVERALYKVDAISATPRWYAWLRELEMAVCCEIALFAKSEPDAHQRFSRCRDRGTLGEWFSQSLSEGCHVVGDDVLRLACYLQIAARFVDLNVDTSNTDRDKIEGRRCWACFELKHFLNEHQVNSAVEGFAKNQVKKQAERCLKMGRIPREGCTSSASGGLVRKSGGRHRGPGGEEKQLVLTPCRSETDRGHPGSTVRISGISEP